MIDRFTTHFRRNLSLLKRDVVDYKAQKTTMCKKKKRNNWLVNNVKLVDTSSDNERAKLFI